MGIQTTYHCDNNGCRRTATSLDGWIGITSGLEDFVVALKDIDPTECKELACCEACALAMIGRRLRKGAHPTGLYTYLKGEPA